MKPLSRKSLFYKVRNQLLFSLIFIAGINSADAQGRVLINEYLSWPSNSCAVTSEYVELYNFGPGPVNMGGYILTDGDFAITIPANTFILPGQYFVIAGQNLLPIGCANISTAVTVNLNWNACGCTSGSIPSTGDGFMTDGGSGSEQIVLLNQSLSIIDAVVRDAVEPSSSISSSTAGGSFPSINFDLDNLSINYEQIGESQGRGNSFARLTKGGCGWLKDPQQSAGAENNTPGGQLYTTSLSITNTSTCTNTGSVAININSSNLAQIFPMRYIIGFDVDDNNVFNQSDQYTYGVDSLFPVIQLDNLSFGRYRVVVETAKGCDLNQIDFVILNCFTLLSTNFTQFNGRTENGKINLSWTVSQNADVNFFEVQASSDALEFTSIARINRNGLGDKVDYQYSDKQKTTKFYRIKLTTTGGHFVYSPITEIRDASPNSLSVEFIPNPLRSGSLSFLNPGKQSIQGIIEFYSANGQKILSRAISFTSGQSTAQVDVHTLPKGLYFVSMRDKKGTLLLSKSLVKLE